MWSASPKDGEKSGEGGFPRRSCPRGVIQRMKSASQQCRKRHHSEETAFSFPWSPPLSNNPQTTPHPLNLGSRVYFYSLLTMGFLAFWKCTRIEAYIVGPLQKQNSGGLCGMHAEKEEHRLSDGHSAQPDSVCSSLGNPCCSPCSFLDNNSY